MEVTRVVSRTLVATATTGTITETGVITVGANGSSFTTQGAAQNINVASQTNVFNGKDVSLSATGNASVKGDALIFAASTEGGNLVGTATTGTITETGVITVGANGSSFTTQGAAQNINLASQTNVFNGKDVSLNATGNASVKGDALIFAASTEGDRQSVV